MPTRDAQGRITLSPLEQNFLKAFPSIAKNNLQDIYDLARVVGESGITTEAAAQQLGITLPSAETQATVRASQTTQPTTKSVSSSFAPTTSAGQRGVTARTGLPTLEPAPTQQDTAFTPDFRFAVDPSDRESSAPFINALLSALGPGIASGQFSNFQGTPSDLPNALAGFQTGSPFENALNQLLLGQLGGGADQQQQGVISTLFGQPAIQSLSTGRASEGLGALNQQVTGEGFGGAFQTAAGQPTTSAGVANTLLGQPAVQSLSAGRASNLFQTLGQQGGGTGSPLQGFLEQQLRSQVQGGGISPEFVSAARERILAPANEALLGRLNRQGGGVADINSPLFQELQRRQEADFANDLTLFGGGQQQAALGQAGQLGQQQFGNLFGVAQAQGQLGQTSQQLNQQAIGLGFQGQQQGFNQILQTLLAQGSLGQNQQQINQRALGLGGQLQNQFAQQGFQATGQGLSREQLALGQQNQVNQFGLGQSAIASELIQTLLAGREGGGGLGTILALLSGSGGGTNIFDLINSGIDIFRGGDSDSSDPPFPGGTGTGGDIPPQIPSGERGGFPPTLLPSILDILFPRGFGTPPFTPPFNPFDGPFFNPFDASNSRFGFPRSTQPF